MQKYNWYVNIKTEFSRTEFEIIWNAFSITPDTPVSLIRIQM